MEIPPRSVDCARTIVEINEIPVEVIIDTGAAVSVITNQFLEKLGIDIEESSDMYILDVNGRKKRALGIVKDIQITVQQKCKTKLKMQVTDSNTYQVVLGNEELGITIKQPISLYNYHHRDEIDEEEVQEIYYKYDHPGIMEDMIDGVDLDHIEGKYFWDDQTLVERFKGKTTEEQEKEMWEQWPHLTKEQRHQLGNLLDVYKNGFAETMEELGQTDVYKHQIPTGDNFTKAQKLRRYSPAQQEFIQ